MKKRRRKYLYRPFAIYVALRIKKGSLTIILSMNFELENQTLNSPGFFQRGRGDLIFQLLKGREKISFKQRFNHSSFEGLRHNKKGKKPSF